MASSAVNYCSSVSCYTSLNFSSQVLIFCLPSVFLLLLPSQNMAAIQLLVKLWLAAAMVIAQDTPASFNMFPVIGTAGLAANIGWTEDCVTAM